MGDLFSVKMRASAEEEHISGAEKIVPAERLQDVVAQLLHRALHHSKGEPDFLNVKIERITQNEVVFCDALPVTTIEVDSVEEGQDRLCSLLEESGIENASAILEQLPQTYGMRGAMFLNVDTMKRLEPDLERGVRATYMDAAEEDDERSDKNHFKEALILATKVANHPNIVGELCISDDPEYVTGYFASKKLGYVRITKLKEHGSPNGGRIFLFRGTPSEAAECIRYLQQQKMLIRLKGVVNP